MFLRSLTRIGIAPGNSNIGLRCPQRRVCWFRIGEFGVRDEWITALRKEIYRYED